MAPDSGGAAEGDKESAGRPGSPRRLPGRWPRLRASPFSGAQSSPSDRPAAPSRSGLPLRSQPSLRSVRLSVRLSGRATSGHRLGWTRRGCPCVQGSCFRSWSCSFSTQVSDTGRRERGSGRGAALGRTGRGGGLRWDPAAAQRRAEVPAERVTRLRRHAVLFGSFPLTFFIIFYSFFFSLFGFFLSLQSGNPKPPVREVCPLESVKCIQSPPRLRIGATGWRLRSLRNPKAPEVSLKFQDKLTR